MYDGADLPDPQLASGVALGVCVHFIASSGFAKLHVAGRGRGGLLAGLKSWPAPGTMRSILRQYATLSFAEGAPLSRRLNAFLRRHDALLVLLSASTLVFECAAVPAALLLPAAPRRLLIVVSCALHAGIALAQRSSPGGSNPLQRRPRGYRYSRG